MDISPLQPYVKASTVPFEQLAGNPNIPEAEKVKEASRQFEAILLRQIIGEARKTVISSSESDNSNESGIYNDMINNQLADSISQSGSFGLSKSIEKQLVHQTLHKDAGQPPAAADAAPAPTHHHS
jgi:flagellar protein FlgJ